MKQPVWFVVLFASVWSTLSLALGLVLSSPVSNLLPSQLGRLPACATAEFFPPQCQHSPNCARWPRALASFQEVHNEKALWCSNGLSAGRLRDFDGSTDGQCPIGQSIV